jgi:pyruvate dehydrogenase E2 component (dihydrolipoamide acetyltransferase)
VSTGTQIDVVMPQMGVSVSEGTVTRWLKQPGDTVALDEPLLEISTDKVDTEVPSPGAGVVGEILVGEGETVEVGTLLALILPEGTAVAAATPPAGDPAPQPVAAAEPPAPAADAESAAAPRENGDRHFVSPVVARIASEHSVDPATVPGTGAGGRVTKKDVLAFIESGAQSPPAPVPAPVPAAEAPAAPTAPPAEARPPLVERLAAAAGPATATDDAPLPGETFEPMTAMRRGIAEHMRTSLDTAAHVTSAIEVDMSKVVAAREALKREYQKAHGVNPTYLSFIAKAVIETLQDWPWVNGEIRGGKIVTRSFVNLGVAVALDGGKGLIVPVIKNAQDLNLLGLARAIADLAERSRTKKLLPDDVQGGTFTITNPGGFGTFHGTPVISQPQAGILGTYALVKRPWVVQDELGQDVIAIRPLMNITLTYDHRLVDGAYSGGFLGALRERLQNWE